jgi:virulence-associated protein VapD
MSATFTKLNQLVTSLQSRQAEVVAGNAVFKRLPKKQQRIAIAKDALKQLDAKKYKASPGDWCNTALPTTFDKELANLESWSDPSAEAAAMKAALSDVHTKDSNVLQPLLLEAGVTCEVCALGSLFASAVRKADGCAVNPLRYTAEYGESGHDFDSDDVSNTLSDYFSDAQQRLMELAFEQGHGSVDVESKNELKAVRMFPSTSTPTQRLRGILNNLIKNDGVFKIDQRRNVDEEWNQDYCY